MATLLANVSEPDSHSKNGLGLGAQLQAYYSAVICPACWLKYSTQEFLAKTAGAVHLGRQR